MVKVNGFLAARLLFPKEWENIVATVPNVPVDIGINWWLSNPDEENTPDGSFCVNKDGEVGYTYLSDACLGVRPAFSV